MGLGGVVDQVKDPFAAGELVQIHRRYAGVGVHPHRGGIDDILRVPVAVQVAVVVRAAAGDGDHIPSPQVRQHRPHCEGGSAGAQNQHLLTPDLGPRRLEQIAEAVVVGVVPVQRAVRFPHNGVDAADALRRRGEFLAVGHHCLFVWDGHVQPPEAPLLEKGAHLVRGELHQLVVITAQLPVDGGGEAVAQVLPQQAELHMLRDHQQMTSL